MRPERPDPAGSTDRPETNDPGEDPEESDTQGHSLLNVELARTLAESRAREVADWGRSEKARRVTREAKRPPR